MKFYPDDKLAMSFQQVYNAGKTDRSFYNVLDDFNVADYSVYPKDRKVIFNESSLKQKALCIPYYLGMKNPAGTDE